MNDKSALKKKIKTYAVYSLIVLVGIVAIYFVFAPDKNKVEEEEAMNMELPDPENEELPDKKEAYLEDEYQNNLSLYGSLDEDLNLSSSSLDSISKENEKEDAVKIEQAKNERESASIVAKDVSKMAKNSDEIERQRKEEERNKRREDELERQLREKEKALQIAQTRQEYNNVLQQHAETHNNRIVQDVPEEKNNDQTSVIPVSTVQKDVVTSLRQSSRNRGFFGMNATNNEQQNIIKATCFGKQVIRDGQHLRLRLSEPMQVGQRILPAGTVVVALCKINEDRLFAEINTIEYQGIITYVSLYVHDAADGQAGLFLPGSLEQDALREIGVDVANSVASATSQSISVYSSEPNAAEQVKTDVGRGVISGTSRFIGRKLMEIKVTVQDMHRVLLVTTKK